MRRCVLILFALSLLTCLVGCASGEFGLSPTPEVEQVIESESPSVTFLPTSTATPFVTNDIIETIIAPETVDRVVSREELIAEDAVLREELNVEDIALRLRVPEKTSVQLDSLIYEGKEKATACLYLEYKIDAPDPNSKETRYLYHLFEVHYPDGTKSQYEIPWIEGYAWRNDALIRVADIDEDETEELIITFSAYATDSVNAYVLSIKAGRITPLFVTIIPELIKDTEYSKFYTHVKDIPAWGHVSWGVGIVDTDNGRCLRLYDYSGEGPYYGDYVDYIWDAEAGKFVRILD